jgi:hypothetical protein
MDAIRQYAKNPMTVGIVGFVIGAIFGLVILGWWLWPVEWTNASPAQLSEEWKVDYMRMAVAAYAQTGDAAKAKERFEAMGVNPEQFVDEVAQDPQGLSEPVISNFRSAVGATTAEVPLPTEAASEKPTRSVWPILLVAFCVLFLVLIAFLAYMFVFRKRAIQVGGMVPTQEAIDDRHQAGYTDYAASSDEAPIAQFMASYKLGDDLFDDSFSIDSASGEFLGECGVGISETIGVGDHKKVTAFEVWLFDKNDIQTVTKVLMSEHAYNDPAIRQRLEAKGEPVLLEPGVETVLETQSLQLVARTTAMSYGNSEMPEDSFFEHLLLELAVWTKPS